MEIEHESISMTLSAEDDLSVTERTDTPEAEAEEREHEEENRGLTTNRLSKKFTGVFKTCWTNVSKLFDEDADDSDADDDELDPELSSCVDEVTRTSGLNYKMAFTVHSGRGLSTTGHVASQVAQCALGLHQSLMEEAVRYAPLLLTWELRGSQKLVLRCACLQHFEELALKCSSLGVAYFIAHDTSRRDRLRDQGPGPTSVLGIFAREETVEEITENLDIL